jgi:hypothetical protein
MSGREMLGERQPLMAQRAADLPVYPGRQQHRRVGSRNSGIFCHLPGCSRTVASRPFAVIGVNHDFASFARLVGAAGEPAVWSRGGSAMTSESPRDPMVALNEVLSGVIDMVMALRQAHRKVPETHELHAELDQLFSDARGWAELLVAADTARGVSALDFMPSVAGRQRPDLWHGPVRDEEVREVVAEQLDQLAEHLQVALSGQDDDRVRELLDRINAELQSHLDSLRRA